MIDKIDIASMTKAELCDYFKSIGEPKFRAEQVFSWISRGTPVSEMTNLSKALREKLEKCALNTLPTVEEKLVSKLDGTVKYLFKLYDGACIESVLMRYNHGNTLCISSQVGCRMGCKFCASTIGGKVRDLLPSELLGQIIAAEKDSGERISNIVMMGIGEPLDNYDNVIKFLKLVNAEGGLNIGYRHISLSTCGVVSGILKLAEEDFPLTLSISLHAANDEKRSEIMPVNNKWKIAELLSACVSYYKRSGRRISFEYTLIAGKNDGISDADELGALLKKAFFGTGAPIHVNLIRVNEVKETGFKKGSEESVKIFADRLSKYGIVATVRRRLGADVNAACGQLRRSNMAK
ncbi:MAG: 23S rRNA (adenine(2503)-C(2))-methyltransferase RlmN [Clostridia bacterium]|nr:23S rRNA (adenine(2503)-C(2))-methyltransferase RlmN [Clostridia bacterium]